MPAELDELDRIRYAYRRYADDAAERRRRDPTNAGLRAITEEFHGRLGRALRSRDLLGPETRVLDAGCGAGGLLAWFADAGVRPDRCHGVDLMPGRVEAARERVPGARVLTGNAGALPWPDACFDVTVLSMVLSSILDRSLAAQVLREARRVTAPGGVVAVYDTRLPNPRNADVRAVGRRELADGLAGFDLDVQELTLLPPLSRRLGRLAPLAYPILSRIPAMRARLLVVAERPR